MADKRHPKVQLAEKLLIDVLNRLPARVVGNPPYGKLPEYLAQAIREIRVGCIWYMHICEASRVAPKAAGLPELRTAARELKRRCDKVSFGSRQLVVDQMRRVAIKRSRDEAIVNYLVYEHTAEAIFQHGLQLDVLVDLIEASVSDLCSQPEPISKKQAEIFIRRSAVLSIAEAFDQSGRGRLTKENLTKVANALAPYFLVETGLAGIKPSTVGAILRSKNRA